MLNRSNSRSKLWLSVLLDEDEKQFQLGEGNIDTEPKLDWDDKQRAQARMLGIALELERKFHPLYLGNRTHNFAVDRREKIEKKASFSDSLEALETRRISSLLNFTQNKPTMNKDSGGKESVYDMILIDKNRDEDKEAQKGRELKRLQEIQEQRRIRMKHDSDKYGAHHMGEYVYLLPIEWMLDGGSVPYPPGYYPINLYDLIIDNDPSLNLSLVPQRDGLPRRKDQVQLRYLPANLHAALIPAAFTSMDIVSLLLLMAGWFLFLLCTAALIGIQAETQAATKCSFNISKNLIYQREIRKDPGLTDRLKKQAEEAGITPNTWHYFVLRKKDIGDDVFNRIALCIQHYYSFYDLVKGWEVLKNSANPEIAKSAIALMDAFLAREYDYMSAKEVRGPPRPSMIHSKRDWQYVCRFQFLLFE
ncbi:hypothetical protein ECG_00488 [Echinococcus granulosus]|uniref:PSP domain-containing protein n=1 Tax=Echinococcus granulosus TaxID=6210 RepID=A0A068WGD8_ECHGR|nr:hypothetical protein ECG_00488 [Echinococcus granulosus]CDS16665.1 hypothetical protein EgrG_000909000 [Echinococcus granulosus]